MKRGNQPWWKKTVVYQVYPRSFKDSTGNGIGDIPGIISKLDYLADLGIETIWFSPFFDSPQEDFGYDIRNYRAIAPEYGTLQDCEALINEIHARDMRIVFDMVLNHTSDQHPWFLASKSSKNDPKRGWYVWHDGRKPGGKKPPNNWKSMITGSGWHYHEPTDQWYWAQFLPFQPDLNYRNPEVRGEMLDTMKFWLSKGADGFRLDIINAIYEDDEFRDNPRSWRLLPSEESPAMLFTNPKYTLNHPDTLAFMRVLRDAIDTFDDPSRFMVGEVSAPLPILKQYMGESGDGLNLTFQFQSLSLKMRAKAVRGLLEDYEEWFPAPLIPTWVFSNHDRFRRISRIGGGILQAKLNAALQLTARGVPFIYYGEEVGMEQHHLPVKYSKDPVALKFKHIPQFIFNIARKIAKESINRDECRTPMQWNASENGGFCPAGVDPWLPMTPSYRERNVAVQENEPDSLLNCYKRFLHARKIMPPLHAGDMTIDTSDAYPSHVVHFIRECRETGGRVDVFLNFSGNDLDLNFPVPLKEIVVSTRIPAEGAIGNGIKLTPWEGIVVQLQR
ncbi:alpha-glucosidase [Candidatus Bathyarchaeota archaeon]|nr:alpha-glucosidase [Candidatus Bathyarchaeota archaeon]